MMKIIGLIFLGFYFITEVPGCGSMETKQFGPFKMMAECEDARNNFRYAKTKCFEGS